VDGYFPRENKTPFRKLIVAVKIKSTLDSMSETLSKKDMVEAFDINILHIENIRNRIERFYETCRDIEYDMNFANSDKKANIPETYITRLGQMEKELMGLNTSICSGISYLQHLYGEIHPRKVQHQANRKRRRERGINEIVEQII
jgi:hypothetical protein